MECYLSFSKNLFAMSWEKKNFFFCFNNQTVPGQWKVFGFFFFLLVFHLPVLLHFLYFLSQKENRGGYVEKRMETIREEKGTEKWKSEGKADDGKEVKTMECLEYISTCFVFIHI